MGTFLFFQNVIIENRNVPDLLTHNEIKQGSGS